MNSAYGALLNKSFKYGRKELGASVTACGRQITTHMLETIHSLLSDEPAKLVKMTEVDDDGTVSNVYTMAGGIILASDTDSAYFKTRTTNKQDAIVVADEIASQVNSTFQGFMQSAFNCQPGYDNLIKAGREVVAERALFQAKKKYVLKVVDLEGKSVDKLKSQGSEIKKSDTPKVIQAFLKDLMGMILGGKQYPDIEKFVNDSRKNLLGKDGDVFSMGVAKQANNVDAKYAEWQRVEKPGKGKVNLPGHIRAAINYNEEVQQHEDGAKLIKAGDKVKVFYLKPNSRGFKSIAFPAELESFPSWFENEFSVDKKLTEEKMFDLKLSGVFSACGWEVPTPQLTLTNKIFKF